MFEKIRVRCNHYECHAEQEVEVTDAVDFGYGLCGEDVWAKFECRVCGHVFTPHEEIPKGWVTALHLLRMTGE